VHGLLAGGVQDSCAPALASAIRRRMTACGHGCFTAQQLTILRSKV